MWASPPLDDFLKGHLNAFHKLETKTALNRTIPIIRRDQRAELQKDIENYNYSIDMVLSLSRAATNINNAMKNTEGTQW